MNGAEKLINAMKKVNESNQPPQSKIVSLTVQSINPLIFELDNRLSITSDFYELSNLENWNTLTVGDIVRAFSYNKGQTYYISEKLPLNSDTNSANLDLRIKNNKTDIQTMKNQIVTINNIIQNLNNIYSNSGTATNTTTDRVQKEVCSLTLPKGTYLVLSAEGSSISSDELIIMHTLGDSNVDFVSGLSVYRNSMSAGGGVAGWRIANVTQDNGVITLYAYVKSTYTITGHLCAIKL